MPGSPAPSSGDTPGMPRFVVGQYVELCTTVPSQRGGTVPGGTRAIVREVDDDAIYLVALVQSESPTGEALWLQEQDLIEA